MATIRTGLGCRKHSTNQQIVHILAKEGTGFECERGCKFVDNEELMASDPLKVQLPKPPTKVQPGTVSLPILVPSELRDRLQERFGDKLGASVASLLGVMLDGDAFVVCGPDQLAVSKILNKQVRNSIELASEIGKIAVERDDARNKCKELEKKSGGAGPMTDGAFRVNLSKEVAEQVRLKAQDNALQASEWLSSAIGVAISNGWF